VGPGQGYVESRQAPGLVRGGRDGIADPYSLIVPDPRHSRHEERLVLLGYSSLQRLLAVMFTERGARLRLISARKATPTERRTYEEATS